MYRNRPLDDDLQDVLDTIQTLKEAMEQHANYRQQLEADKTALTRRLSEALAAERRQRCRAAAMRAKARRALAATQPVISAQREIIALKRELAQQQKNFNEERKVLENKISALQQENTRIKEEKEAALAAADFAKEDTTFGGKSAHQVTSSTANIPALPRMSGGVFPSPSSPPQSPPIMQTRPTPLPPPQRNANALWTGSGQLVWNPPPLNLTSTTNRAHAQRTPRKSGSSALRRYKVVAGFQTARQLMHASNSEEDASQSGDTQFSQSDLTGVDEELAKCDDDCTIILDKMESKVQPAVKLKLKDAKVEDEEDAWEDVIPEDGVPEKYEAKDTASFTTTSSDSNTAMAQRPLKRPRKKRKMFTNPSYDDMTA